MAQTVSSIRLIMEESGDLTYSVVNSPGYERYNFSSTDHFGNINLVDGCHLQEEQLFKTTTPTTLGYQVDLDLTKSDPKRVRVTLKTGSSDRDDQGNPTSSRYEPQFYSVSVYAPIASDKYSIVKDISESSITYMMMPKRILGANKIKKGTPITDIHVGDRVDVILEAYKTQIDVIDYLLPDDLSKFKVVAIQHHTPKQPKAGDATFFETADQEIANRIARALIHASALCYHPEPGNQTYF